MKYNVVIPAAGTGSRMNLGYNKLLFILNGKTIIEQSIKSFIEDKDCKLIILVCNELDESNFKNIIIDNKIIYVRGGAIRQTSVNNGLQYVTSDYVLIHDGARPYLTKKLLETIKSTLKDYSCVIPVVKAKEATVCNGDYLDDVYLVQTPQAFHTSILKKAMKQCKSIYRDEGSLVKKELDITLTLIEGEYQNIKITTIEDIKGEKENED